MDKPTDISVATEKITQIIGQIKKIKIDVATRFFRLGELLKQVQDEQLYFLRGYDTFNSFLKDPDVSISYQLACRFIRLYEVFILKFQIPKEQLVGVEYTKLEMLLAIEDKSKEVVEYWIHTARELRRRDFLKALKKELGRPVVKTVQVWQCPFCNREGEAKQFIKKVVKLCNE